MASENQKQLRALKKKGGSVWAQVVADVPPSTLHRHLTKDQAPHPDWMLYYWHGMKWTFSAWHSPNAHRRAEKQAKKLADARIADNEAWLDKLAAKVKAERVGE
jgi:hypothetical protein